MPPPTIREVDEYIKDLKKLDRFRNIDQDFDVFKKAIVAEFPKHVSGVVVIPGFGGDTHPVYKARKFRCRALQSGSMSGIRVIYTYNPYTNEIVLLETYYKGDKENHDVNRIKKHLVRKC